MNKAFYSILADESSDVSKKEQLSFSVRICDDNYEVSENFVGIYECSQGLSSDALLHYTKDILLRFGMNGERMAAMSFDGAAAMKALARLLKADVAPNAISPVFVRHCRCLSKTCFAFRKNTQRFYKNEMVSNATDYNILRLQGLSVTRWITRVKAADVVF